MYPDSDRRPLLRFLDEEPISIPGPIPEVIPEPIPEEIPESIPEEIPVEPRPIQSNEIVDDVAVISSDDEIVDTPIIQQPLNLYDSSSASLWKGGDQRDFWSRPCANGYRSILIADSQLQSFNKEDTVLPGFLLCSFSGMDIMKGSN